jgi:hypothetical protein
LKRSNAGQAIDPQGKTAHSAGATSNPKRSA